MLTPFHPSYPTQLLARLGTHAPPLLYAAGPVNQLMESGRKRLAVVESRDATEEQVQLATRASEMASDVGWDVVSGGAKGIDSVALNATVDRSAVAVAVMAEGVRRALRRSGLRRLVADDEAVVVSAVGPDAPFTVGAAMGRNKYVYGLANVTLVAAAVEGSGGTWAGATEALKHGYGRVAVPDDGTPAMQELARQGAAVISDVSDLFAPAETATAAEREGTRAGQLRLL